jgi:hypothetical protein
LAALTILDAARALRTLIQPPFNDRSLDLGDRRTKECDLMRNIVFASALALLGLAAAVPAQAMPFPLLGDEAPSALTLTAGGCGIGFHRGPYGGCRPNGGGYYAYGYRPYAYGYRPYGYYGRRCWWRGGVRVCA